MCGRMVYLKGTLYVLGGGVECYDPIADKWIFKTTIPVKKIYKYSEDLFTGGVLKLDLQRSIR